MIDYQTLLRTPKILKAGAMLFAGLLFFCFACGCPDEKETHFCSGEQCDDVGWCSPHVYTCCVEPGGSCCNFGYTETSSLSQVSVPDLTNSNLDGIVDFGRTSVIVTTSDGDSFSTNLAGRMAVVVVGECEAVVESEPDGPVGSHRCRINVLLLELSGLEERLLTAERREVTALSLRNADAWDGYLYTPSGDILMGTDAQLAMEATVDGKRYAALLPLAEPLEFRGRLVETARYTESGYEWSNRISIHGSFANGDIKAALLTATIWAGDCTPSVVATARCGLSGIDPAPTLYLEAHPHQLGGLQNQDLCAAMYRSEWPCYSCVDSDGERRFSCIEKGLPDMSAEGFAERFRYEWRNGFGDVIGSKQTEEFQDPQTPVYPVTLTITNEWGKSVSAVLPLPQNGQYCPKNKVVYYPELVRQWTDKYGVREEAIEYGKQYIPEE